MLADPAPSLRFTGYDDANLFFELRVWVDHPQRRGRIWNDLYYMIWPALVEHGLKVPNDQLGRNLLRGWEKLLADQE